MHKYSYFYDKKVLKYKVNCILILLDPKNNCKNMKVAIVGASGAVGQEFLKC